MEFAQYASMMSYEPRQELERFGSALAKASHHDNPKLKAALYLQGPPGVGKTEAVFKLGKTLELPVIKINLAEFPNIGALKGIRCEYFEENHCGPGLIAQQLFGQPYKNAILFFDEADHVLNRIQEGQQHEMVSFMLDLLEGKTKSIYNPYFGFEIDIRHFGIILAGNQPLSNKALQSRLNILSFGNYTEDYRIKAAKERFLPEILESYSEALKQEDLTQQDWLAIDAIAKREHEKLEKTGEDPGFRGQIRELERFVHQKATSI